MTKKLYHDDPYLREFTSTVAQSINEGERTAIILEQTLFYPSSGGQPHDTGTLNNVPVIDVIEDSGRGVIHYLSEPLQSKLVNGRIDWARRFDHMQQHTGQHLLSQAFLQLCKAETISFHMGDKSATLDLNQRGFSIATIAAVEEFANQIIYENRPVIGRIVNKKELDQYPLRKLPPVEERIRLIEIEDFDFSPCGGTHCSRTGEIGITKIRHFENYKEGTRIHFLCGLRALKDYQGKARVISKIGKSLSSGEPDLYESIKKIQNELRLLQRTHSSLNKQLLDYEADALVSECKTIGNANIIAKVFEDRNPKDLKLLAGKVLDNLPNTVILFGVAAQGKASLFFVRSEELDCDVQKLMIDACAIVEGRGGGRPQQAQGGGPAVEKLDEVLRRAYEQITNKGM